MELIYDNQYLFQYPVLTVEMRKKCLTTKDLIHITRPDSGHIKNGVINYGSISYKQFKLIRDVCFPDISLKYLMQRKQVGLEKYITQFDTIKFAPDM